MSITRVGQNAVWNATTAIATTTALNVTTNAGDLILVYAYRNGVATAPTLPSGYTTIASDAGANTNAALLAYKIATAGETTAPVFTNATGIVLAVYRGTLLGLKVGTNAISGGNNLTAIPFATHTLSRTDGSVLRVLAFGHKGTTNAASATAPTGFARITSAGTAGAVWIGEAFNQSSAAAATMTVTTTGACRTISVGIYESKDFAADTTETATATHAQSGVKALAGATTETATALEASSNTYSPAGSTRPWVPSDLDTAKKVGWFDAQDASSITHSSGAVSAWNNKFGTAIVGNFAQATSGFKPAYSATGFNSAYGGITFVDDNLENTIVDGSLGNNLTAIYIHKHNTGTTNDGRMLSIRDNSGGLQDYLAGGALLAINTGGINGNYFWHANATNMDQPGVADLLPTVVSARFRSLNSDLRQNGALGAPVFTSNPNTTNTINFATADQLRVGCSWHDTTENYKGVIAEIIYIKDATDADIEKVEGYAMWRYGLQGTLDSAHPYKASAPTIALTSGAHVWVPSDAPGAYSWLSAKDAADYTLSTGTIIAIADKTAQSHGASIGSRNGCGFSSTGLDGTQPAFTFASGSSQSLDLAVPANLDNVAYCFLGNFTHSQYMAIFGCENTADVYSVGINSSNQVFLDLFNDTNIVQSGSVASGVQLITVTRDRLRSTYEIRINGTSIVTGSYSHNVASSGLLNHILGGVYNRDYMDGALSDTAVLTDYNGAELEKLEASILWDWGYESLLPSGHEYETTAPELVTTFGWVIDFWNAGWSGYTLRQTFPAALQHSDGNQFRVRLVPPPLAGTTCVISKMYLGHAASSGSLSFDGSQVQVTFGGSAGVTLTAGGAPVWSDLMTLTVDKTKDLIGAAYFSSGDISQTASSFGPTGAVRAYVAGDDAATTTVSGGAYNVGATNALALIDTIEVSVSTGGGPTTYNDAAAESATATSAQVASAGFAAARAEAVTLTETSAGVFSVNAATTESATAAESSASSNAINAARAESSTTTDASVSSGALLANATEASTATDAQTGGLAQLGAVTEASTVAEQSQGGTAQTGATTEASTVAESSASSMAQVAARVEVATATEASVSAAQLVAALTEALASGDAVTSIAVNNVAVSESAVATESSTNGGTQTVSVNENSTATESSSNTSTATRAVNESAQAQEASVSSQAATATRAEASTVTEAHGASLATAVAVNESAPATGTHDGIQVQALFTNEQVSALDAQTATQVLAGAAQEQATAADSAQGSLGALAQASELATALDSTVASGLFARSVQESATATHAQTGGQLQNADRAETASVTDIAAAAIVLGNFVNESIAATDAQTCIAAFNVGRTESVLLTELSAAGLAMSATRAEATAATDAQAVTRIVATLLTESVLASDGATYTFIAFGSVEEALVAAERSDTTLFAIGSVTEVALLLDSTNAGVIKAVTPRNMKPDVIAGAKQSNSLSGNAHGVTLIGITRRNVIED